MKSSITTRILFARLLTRSGDQAWDFAVPIALLSVFPGHLRIAALYYLIAKLSGVIFLPRLASFIDRQDRYATARLGLSLQAMGVIVAAAAIAILWQFFRHGPDFFDLKFSLTFSILAFGGILSALGVSFMKIAVANDLAPSLLQGEKLAAFNRRFRQIDLIAEVEAPVIAGLLLALNIASVSLAGFLLIALWNIISFFPEFGILRSIYFEHSALRNKVIENFGIQKTSALRQIHDGWRDFFRQRCARVMIAYALLWFSVLSPHGVLLTAFLQDGWRLPEWQIGLFRGSGAFFGLLATMIFPLLLPIFSIVNTSKFFLGFQALTVALASIFFIYESHFGFLIMILLSRVGLYGFILGEIQLRQEQIAPSMRGQVNGFASALNNIATLGLFGLGAMLPSTSDFRFLVFLSSGFVLLAFTVFVFDKEKTV